MFSLFINRIAALVVVGVTLVACSEQAPRQAPVRAVTLVTVGDAAVPLGPVNYSGEVRAQSESLLGFQVGGKLKSRPVDIGQRVAAGDLLASLDSSDYQLSVASAQAQREAAQSQLELANADLVRYKELAAKGFIGEAQLQRYQANYNAASAQLASAKAGESAQGNRLAYTQLRAPSAGVITGAEGDIGQVVGAGAVVVRLAQNGPREVQFAVPQQRLATVALGQAVQVSSLALNVASSATVVDIAASADPVTRSYVVRVRLPADAQWPLGSTAQVSLAVQIASNNGSTTVKLPSTAVWLDGSSSAVWVLDVQTMAVVAKPVQVVQVVDDGLLVSGLQQGDEVVSAGAHALTPGQVVKRFTN